MARSGPSLSSCGHRHHHHLQQRQRDPEYRGQGGLLQTFLSWSEQWRAVQFQHRVRSGGGTRPQDCPLHHQLLRTSGGQIRHPADQTEVSPSLTDTSPSHPSPLILRSGSSLSWAEVVLEETAVTLPAEDRAVVAIWTRNPVTHCPASHPFAFKNGSRCCETNLRRSISFLSSPKVDTVWKSRYQLKYTDNSGCYGPGRVPQIKCPGRRCLNYKFKSYSCSQSKRLLVR